MSAELIYKTTSLAAIAWWENAEVEREKARLLRNEYAGKMTVEFGATSGNGRDSKLRELMVAGPRVVGLASGYTEQPPLDSGWRLDSKDRYWAPKLATAAGKARAKELKALASYDHQATMPEIGIPQLAFAGSYLYRAGLDFDTATLTLYQIWGSRQCDKECAAAQAKHPEIEWVEVLRSEWYAREESKAAQS